MQVADNCFHCALPNPAGARFTVEIDGTDHCVCCPGCKAVAELIRDSGMTQYYKLRDTPEPGAGKPAEDETEWSVFNSAQMLQSFATLDGENAEATIYAGGMYCSACSWLIQSALTAVSGVQSVDVNPVTHRIRVRWNSEQLGLGGLLAHLADLGYRPQPLTDNDISRPEVEEQRYALKRLLVASLGMMQVMMFAVGLYAGDFQGMDAEMQRFLRLVSLLVTTPVVFYAARPFFSSAWRGVIARKPGMDLPVSIAIGSAYVASSYATFSNGAAVWFDSVVMFVFFLTLGRYLEMRARHRSIDRGVALSQVLPNTAVLITGNDRSVVPVSQLKSGDTIQIRSGEAIPADGVITSGFTSVDESLLTGEAAPVRRAVGDPLAAGSVNVDGLVELRVARTGSDTTLGAISRLSQRARFTRPNFVNLADRMASYIVVGLLLVAAVVASYWSIADPERAFVITLSVLVVTCPCALALATPAAFATAASRLAELKLLLTKGDAIEVMSRTTDIFFDKTGTLTTGRPVVQSITVHHPDFDDDHCLQIAAALERASTHPLANAFQAKADNVVVTDAEVHVAEGVRGTISGQHFRIGSRKFTGIDIDAGDGAATLVHLTADGDAIATFEIRDEIRPDAAATLDVLRRLGLSIAIVSGDHEHAVAALADELGITETHFDCSPDDKLKLIRARQSAGKRVVMIGDGINDAPVLAGADASIAPGHGALLAQTSADIIMLGDSLAPVATAIRMSRATMRTVRQNLAWAIGYNALALPLAAAGWVPPWLAAIGMSLSSLIVVMNALRLNRFN